MTDRADLITYGAGVAAVASLAPDFDGGDPYGSTMNIWFECAEHLAQRGEQVPDEWEWRQGLGLDELDPLFNDYASDYLRLLGNRAMELSDVCKRLGLDY